MKILIASTLIVVSTAMRLTPSNEITRYSSQEQCNEIERLSHSYYYKFNPEACACFFTFKRRSRWNRWTRWSRWSDWSVNCSTGTVFNPFHEPFNTEDLCIPQEEYDAIFMHDLDSNCQPVADSGDDDEEFDCAGCFSQE